VDADSTDRRLLRDLLVRDGRVAVAGDVTDGSDLVRLIRHAGPDVLFLDARTPSDLLERMLAGERQLPCLVVLSSALASDAAVAYNVGAADFLLKPYGYARLDLAIARLQARLDELARLETPAPIDQRRARRGSDTLTVASQGRVECLPTSSIVWIASAGDEARIFATDRVVRARSSLAELAQRLDPQRFIRTHRGALVNVEMVTRLESSGAGGVVMLASGQTVPVAKRRIAQVRRALRLAQRRLPTVPAVRSA
jgi:two-component system, LytTR family, response regulator